MNRGKQNSKRFTIGATPPSFDEVFPHGEGDDSNPLPRPEPRSTPQGDSGDSRDKTFRLGKKGFYLAMSFLILLASLAILLPRVLDLVNKDPGPQPIHIEDTFMDIDSDGDMDFVEQADVLLNCGGQLCSPTPPPALQAPRAGELGGDPSDLTDPDVGGGSPDTPDE